MWLVLHTLFFPIKRVRRCNSQSFHSHTAQPCGWCQGVSAGYPISRGAPQSPHTCAPWLQFDGLCLLITFDVQRQCICQGFLAAYIVTETTAVNLCVHFHRKVYLKPPFDYTH
jgi:hypothetical protein